ncbi:MAG: indole-3-glycerol-phosphate synthase [Candidatus Eremiobacteraeota bacterium]|nr:indole-3-glycerol-phosphate synthase [Candidatus Eremiobacteraeota bacterium]
MFLEKILDLKRQLPAPEPGQLAEWREQALSAPATRGFARALTSGPRPRIIAEFKRASPSKGVLSGGLDPVQQARAYEAGGAVAMSILTEEAYFQGSAADLRAARAACSLPVIRKDFLLHDWEIPQSRCWGADAVLLIAAALPTPRLMRMLELCQEYGLDALVEVHTEEEARMVAPLRPPLIGINNRDLISFRVELEVTRRLLPLLPDGSVKVSESGFENSEQLAAFPEVDAFLIGETLVRTEEPQVCLRRLRGD